MKQVVKLRVLPSDVEASALDETLRACNEAASWLSQQMHTARVFRKFDAQRRFYRELRTRFGLAAQPSIRVIAKVTDAYGALNANITAGNYGPLGSSRRRRARDSPIVFRSAAAQPFDARCLSWQFAADAGRTATISIWTVSGRLKNIRIVAAPTHLYLLRTHVIGETDLIRRNGKWFLHATVEAMERPLTEPTTGFLGVDMGIVNIATTSTGDRASGIRLTRYRKRQMRLRRRLQGKGTSSARRLLKTRRRKEARFASDVNHQISKRIVAEAERTGHGIAVEELTGIRERVRLRRPQRAALHSWAFAQLRSFLAYKAKRSGVAFVEVDPAYTSQMCSACGWVDRRNRRCQAVFECGRCRFVGHADHNATINIASRGVERWGEVMRPHAASTLATS